MTSLPYFAAKLWVLVRCRLVHRGMSVGIGVVMGQGTQREGEFIYIAGVVDQIFYKITRAHVMQQVRKIVAAVRIVADVLNDAAAVCVGMRLGELFRRGLRKTPKQKRDNVILPREVYNFLMRKNRVGMSIDRGRRLEEL